MAKGKRIGNLTAAVLVVFALIFDAGQFIFTAVGVIPIIGLAGIALAFLLTLIAFIVIFFIIVLSGAPIFSGRLITARIASLIAPLVIELIPFLAAIPAITPGVIAFIIVSRMDEKDEEPVTRRIEDYQRLQDQRNTLLTNQQLQERQQLEEEASIIDRERLEKEQDKTQKRERRDLARGNAEFLMEVAENPAPKQQAPGVLQEQRSRATAAELRRDQQRYEYPL